ncbi:MAG: D-aminoacyl-tRNA deacylase [Actinomyces sp.]|uniref:D-aminoacyl-tRNA deacylase n=1 Tax=Actinomyces sp. TaxID=29317 RepID=UPI0026DC6480|nr:D-aminoacyl-tRNA deacylase [Actinomyces sp.]MDO4244314.1 D-aminoacyl-tRNA deacylase [Actinomyces sp.]
MRAVLQRVRRAAVRVEGADGPVVVGEITRPGLLALVGATHDDGPEEVATITRKIAELRLFEPEPEPQPEPQSEPEADPAPGAGRSGRGSERSVTDLGAPVLLVSQFTLYADVRKGRRPSWNAAAPGPVAEPLVEAVAAGLRARGLEVATGSFGAHMRIDMEADGPVTILLEA